MQLLKDGVDYFFDNILNIQHYFNDSQNSNRPIRKMLKRRKEGAENKPVKRNRIMRIIEEENEINEEQAEKRFRDDLLDN